MKKLILSMFIVLGTMASVSAQTFNFNCDDQLTDNGGVIDTFLPLSDGFSPAQMSSLEAIGYEQGTTENGDAVLANVYAGITISIPNAVNPNYAPSVIPNQPVRVAALVGSFTDGRDDSVSPSPVYKYRVGITAESHSTFSILHFFNSQTEVNDFLLSIYAPAPASYDVADYEGNGVTNHLDWRSLSLYGLDGDVFTESIPGDTFTGQLMADFIGDYEDPTDLEFYTYDSYDRDLGLVNAQLVVGDMLNVTFPEVEENGIGIRTVNIAALSIQSGNINEYVITKRFRFVSRPPAAVVYDELIAIRASSHGTELATSFLAPYQSNIGTSRSFDLNGWTNVIDANLPTDVIFSLPLPGQTRYNANASIDGNILTIDFPNDEKFQVRVYASSELTGQSTSDIRFLTEDFQGREPHAADEIDYVNVMQYEALMTAGFTAIISEDGNDPYFATEGEVYVIAYYASSTGEGDWSDQDGNYYDTLQEAMDAIAALRG